METVNKKERKKQQEEEASVNTVRYIAKSKVPQVLTFPKRFVSKRVMSWYSLVTLHSTLLRDIQLILELIS